MCRGADLGICCEAGCGEPIRCQDTGGYCNTHDPFILDEPSCNVADDPEKRRVYDLSRVLRGITSTEASISASERRLLDLRERAIRLSEPPCGDSCPGECGWDPSDLNDPCAVTPGG